MVIEQHKTDEKKYRNMIFDLENIITYNKQKESNDNYYDNKREYLKKEKSDENNYSIKKYYNKIIEE